VRELPPPQPAGFKYRAFDDAPGSTHRLVVSLVPAGARVLEVGCATGYMSRVLRDEKRCSVVGIEVSPSAAEEARPHLERLLVGDVEQLDLDEELGSETFDVVLFADVLEHLRDPAAVLRRIRPFVAEAGVVVASIPNVAHASVRLALLDGEFRYRPLGLLDDTHLRFFTRATIDELFESSGFVVEDWHRRRLDPDQTEFETPESEREIQRRIASDPEATTYQFVVRAVPSDASRRLAATRELLREARAELSELRPLRQELEEHRAQLRAALGELEQLEPVRGVDVAALRHAHEALSRRLLAERSAMGARLEEIAAELEHEQHQAKAMREEIEWRTGVMEALEEARENLQHQLTAVQGSRSMRLTTPLRSFAGLFRRRP
jgi:2-polyprenyl-3-methyl-5-hydroxy-6-metoxy-1,4-benzoquinol methylase